MEHLKKSRSLRAAIGSAIVFIFMMCVLVQARPAAHKQNQSNTQAASPAKQQDQSSETINERTERRGSQLLIRQTQAEADAKTRGCMSSGCHTPIDSVTMHSTSTVRIGCTDCHGGDASVMNTAAAGTTQYNEAKPKAHPRARFADHENRSANRVRPYTLWLKESAEWIKFANP